MLSSNPEQFKIFIILNKPWKLIQMHSNFKKLSEVDVSQNGDGVFKEIGLLSMLEAWDFALFRILSPLLSAIIDR